MDARTVGRSLRLLLPVAFAAAGVAAQAVYVGVIDEGVTCGATDEKPNPLAVRVLFYKAGSAWKTVVPRRIDPSKTAWVAAFDGRHLGRVAVKNSKFESIEDERVARRDLRFPFMQIDKFAFPRELGKRFGGGVERRIDGRLSLPHHPTVKTRIPGHDSSRHRITVRKSTRCTAVRSERNAERNCWYLSRRSRSSADTARALARS